MKPAFISKPAVISVDPDRVGPDGFLVGVESLHLDGLPFPWPTISPWRIIVSSDGIAVLQVEIAVTFAPTPQPPMAPGAFTGPHQGSKP